MTATLMNSSLFLKLKERPECIYEHGVEGFFQSDYQSQWQKQFFINANYLRVYHDLKAKARAVGINRVVALKGTALLGEIYPDIGVRNMADLDILVLPAERASFEKLLVDEGFSKVLESTWEANAFKGCFSRMDNGFEMVVEVHEDLFVFRRYSDWSIIERNDKDVLATADQFVHLMGHLAHQHTFLKLSWLFDCALFLQYYRDSIDWQRVDELVQRLNLRSAFAATMLVLNRDFSLGLETPTIKSFRFFLFKHLLTQDFLLYPKKKRNLWRYYLLKHLVKDKITESMTYNVLWLKQVLCKKMN